MATTISSKIAVWIFFHVVWISFQPCHSSLANYSPVDIVSGCSITNTSATCESQDLNKTVNALPSFITNLHVSLYGENYLYPGMFDRFNNITEIDIFSPNQTAYYQSSLRPYMSNDSHSDLTDEYFTIQSLKVLRLKLAFKFNTRILPTSFRWLKDLEVLDFTRAAFISIPQFVRAFYKSPTILPLKHLTLTNVQGFNERDECLYSGFLNFSALVCPFRLTLEYLDLRYNDITLMSIDTPSCVNKLKYLDLRHNLLSNIVSGDTHHPLKLVSLGYALFAVWTIEIVKIGHQWQLEEYHEGLWDGDNDSFADIYMFASGHKGMLNRLEKDNDDLWNADNASNSEIDMSVSEGNVTVNRLVNDDNIHVKGHSAMLKNLHNEKSATNNDTTMTYEHHETQNISVQYQSIENYDLANEKTKRVKHPYPDDYGSAIELLLSGILSNDSHHSSIIGDVWTWIKSVKGNCPGINFNKFLFCVKNYFPGAQNRSQQCLFFKCMVPSLTKDELKNCSIDIKSFVKSDLFHKACNYKHCFYGIPIPLPSSWREFKFNSVKSPGIANRHDINITGTVWCFFENNNVQRVDVSGTQLLAKVDPIIWRSITIRGLHRLTFLSMQDCQRPFVLNKTLFWDMPSLEELHIGGSKLTDNNSVNEEMFQKNHNLRLLNLSNSDLICIPNGTFLNARNLTVLDLSHNRLSANNLTFTISQSKLERLDLQDNKLDYLPTHFCQQLDLLAMPLQIDLSDNPLQCDCHTIQFIQWIQAARHQIKFTNEHTYMCSYKVQNTLIFSPHLVQQLQKDCSKWRLPVIASASTLATVFLVAALILLHRKRWALRHFLFVLRERYENMGSEENIQDYQWDAFILYSSEDDDRRWVHFELVKQLEQNYGFKLCIHHRDFIPGDDIVDNIEMGIRNSRKVVAILSPNFLHSNYGTTEINMTCSVDSNKLIFVMYRPLPLDEYIPAMLRHQLETRTYLEWDKEPETAQTLFWKRLTKALYAKPKRRE